MTPFQVGLLELQFDVLPGFDWTFAQRELRGQIIFIQKSAQTLSPDPIGVAFKLIPLQLPL